MIGKLLDHKVRVFDGRPHGGMLQIMVSVSDGSYDFSPSERGDHLLDKFGISTLKRADGTWWATLGDPTDDEVLGYEGASRLEAALRTLAMHLLASTSGNPESDIGNVKVPAILVS